MPNAECPQCDIFQEQVQEAARRKARLEDRTTPLRDELQRGLEPFGERLNAAITARMHIEAEHAALVQAAAEMTGEIAKMTGSGAFAVAGFNPADVSRQEVEGWLRVEVGPTTMWFRNAAAQEAFMRASGLAAALDGLARLEARRDEALQRVIDANDRENSARNELSDAEDAATQKLRDHYDQIAAAEAEREAAYQAWQACLARCRRGDVEDQRVGLAGVVMMMVGLTLVILGNPFGLASGSAQVAEVGGTSVTSGTGAGSTSTAPPAATVVARIGPIRAVFSQPAQTTTYTLPVEMEGAVPGVDWRGADCGQFRVTSPTVFIWNHPHPPCDPTTNHADRTIIATIQIGAALVECRYQGSATGTGTPCTGPGGTTVAPAGNATPR